MFSLFQKPQEKVSEIFLLIHPFHGIGHPDSEVEKYYRLWLQALKDYSCKPNTYAVIALLEFAPLYNERNEKMLQKEAKKRFRNRLFMKRSGRFFGPRFFDDENLESRVDGNDVKLVASGVYTERCVDEAICVMSKRYGIPFGNIFLDLSISVDAGDVPELQVARVQTPILPYAQFRGWMEQRYEKLRVKGA